MSRQSYTKDAYNRVAYIESFRHTTLRLASHDYSGPGAYHVINCAKGIEGRGPLFVHPVLHKLMENHWFRLVQRFPTVHLDEFKIMPDHLHFIIWPNRWPDRAEKPPFLWQIIRAYKSNISVDWIRYVKRNHPDWSAKIWQKRYYERIIRIGELDPTRRYIQNNHDLPDKVYKMMDWIKSHYGEDYHT